MRQQYFVVVLAHSLHGRLRRIHVPHTYVYVLIALVLFGSVAMFGMVSSYLRMTLKVSNYNSLREEVGVLRVRYEALQRETDENGVTGFAARRCRHQPLPTIASRARSSIAANGPTTRLAI